VTDLSRRALIKASAPVGAALLTGGLAPAEAEAQIQGMQSAANDPPPRPVPAPGINSHAQPTGYLFLNSEEAAFVEASVARLIPADEKWGGAIEAGVPDFVDKQLGGAWGAGERLYRGGPWQPGADTQGYQLPFTPSEFFRTAIAAINKELKTGTPFAKMSAADQDAYLQDLERGGKDLGGVPSKEFFAALWQITREGFFSDPVYGGNREMVSWRMIGFPGAYASYYDVVDQHGIAFQGSPTSLGSDAHGHVHVHPEIPARLPE
jgi:gluconate 2-dehydrogenase gamma chain